MFLLCTLCFLLFKIFLCSLSRLNSCKFSYAKALPAHGMIEVGNNSITAGGIV